MKYNHNSTTLEGLQPSRELLLVPAAVNTEEATISADEAGVDVSAFFESYIKKISSDHDYSNVAYVKSESNGVIPWERYYFTSMVDCIVSNCIGYSDTSSGVVISQSSQGTSRLLVEVQSIGVSLGEDWIEEMFESIDLNNRRDQTGLGLFMAKTIIDFHSGIIEVFNTDIGHAYRITLPAKICP